MSSYIDGHIKGFLFHIMSEMMETLYKQELQQVDVEALIINIAILGFGEIRDKSNVYLFMSGD
jgi:hypothetical protein